MLRSGASYGRSWQRPGGVGGCSPNSTAGGCASEPERAGQRLYHRCPCRRFPLHRARNPSPACDSCAACVYPCTDYSKDAYLGCAENAGGDRHGPAGTRRHRCIGFHDRHSDCCSSPRSYPSTKATSAPRYACFKASLWPPAQWRELPKPCEICGTRSPSPHSRRRVLVESLPSESPFRWRSGNPHPPDLRRSAISSTPLLSPLATTALVMLFLLFILAQREDIRDRFLRLAGTPRPSAHDVRI